VFVNGYFAPHFSNIKDLPVDMCVENLSSAVKRNPEEIERYLGKADKKGNDFFSHLNGAFFADGTVIRIPDNYACEIPIHLIFLTLGNGELRFSATRNLIIMGRNSSATLVESYNSLDDQPALTNSVTEVFNGENSSLRHHILQLQNEKSHYFGSTNITIPANSRYQNTWISLGSKISRNDVNATLAGTGSNCRLLVFMPAGMNSLWITGP
ncbi:MAG TPA: hypothetical protein ENO01_01245, partial [Candidatus Marinimicrobia bacterium]|nr:hypothetical protein [Candidatus Neomarinimicrobiota bacterium]